MCTRIGGIVMRKPYQTAQDVSRLLGVSESYAYHLIREMNEELKRENYVTIAGKVPTKKLEEKFYGLEIK